MRNSSDTMKGMSPRRPDSPDAHTLSELTELARKADQANGELRSAVLRALTAGGSVRTVAVAAGLSPTTVQKWKTEMSRGS